MLRAVMKPCLSCQQLIEARAGVNRCKECETNYQSQRHKKQAPHRNRDHYRGNYRSRAKAVRDNAESCWYCGEGFRPDDPCQADHVIPQDVSDDALLLPIHRSCNIKRAHKIKMMQKTKTNSSTGLAGGEYRGVG